MIMCPGMNYAGVIFWGDGMPPAAVPVTLTASERKILKKRVRGAKRRTVTGCGPRSCWLPPAAGIMSGSPLAWGPA